MDTSIIDRRRLPPDVDGVGTRPRWPGYLTRREVAARWGLSKEMTIKILAAHGIDQRPPRGQSRPLLISLKDIEAIEDDPF